MLRKFAKSTLKRLSGNDYQTLNHIELSKKALLGNVSLINSQHRDFEIIPVLKGNAYGHGLEQIALMLNDANCKYLAVDGYFEAAKIRDISKHRILVMGYILSENVRLLDTVRCSFVVQDVRGLKAFGDLGRPVKIHVEINTGFNRMGIRPEGLPEYLIELKRYPNLELEGVMTHLVDADNESDDSFNEKQQQLFDQCVEKILGAGFHPRLVHIAQTAGSTKIRSKHANAIRLGIGLYGINPLSPRDPNHRELAKLRPVLELKSTIVNTIDLQPGDSVSYNATFTTTTPMRVGVLPLGYYEGVPRALSNKGYVTFGTHELPIVGRVCMNHTIVDLKDSKAQVGDVVSVISNNTKSKNSIEYWQNYQGLFPYTSAVSISESVRRLVV